MLPTPASATAVPLLHELPDLAHELMLEDKDGARRQTSSIPFTRGTHMVLRLHLQDCARALSQAHPGLLVQVLPEGRPMLTPRASGGVTRLLTVDLINFHDSKLWLSIDWTHLELLPPLPPPPSDGVVVQAHTRT